jgi:hypothetical protein
MLKPAGLALVSSYAGPAAVALADEMASRRKADF